MMSLIPVALHPLLVEADVKVILKGQGKYNGYEE